MVKALLFDLDGTLIDSSEDLAVSVNQTLDEFGHKPIENEDVISFLGEGAKLLIKYSLMKSTENMTIDDSYTEKVLHRYKEIYSEHLCDTTQAYGGIPELLEYLQSRSVKMALITNKPERFTRLILGYLALDVFFNPVYGYDSLEKIKPDPFPLLSCMKRWGISSDKVVMIGDNHTDVDAGRSAGVKTVFCTYGFGSEKENKADYSVNSVVQLREVLISLLDRK